jgi:hypothetical protein
MPSDAMRYGPKGPTVSEKLSSKKRMFGERLWYSVVKRFTSVKKASSSACLRASLHPQTSADQFDLRMGTGSEST